MTFPQSIKTCFAKYADFSGRASRPEFWWFFLFIELVSAGAFVVDCLLLDNCGKLDGALDWLWRIATLLPSLAVGARRLHDSGRSGWWQLLSIPLWIWYFIPESHELGDLFDMFFLITFIPLIVIWCFRTWPEANKYGEPATSS